MGVRDAEGKERLLDWARGGKDGTELLQQHMTGTCLCVVRIKTETRTWKAMHTYSKVKGKPVLLK